MTIKNIRADGDTIYFTKGDRPYKLEFHDDERGMEMSKFKVGDRVRDITNESLEEGVVAEVGGCGDVRINWDDGPEGHAFWPASDFELVPDDKPSDEVWLVFNGFVLVNYTTREEAMQYVRDAIDRCEAVGSLTVYKATPVEIKITLGE